MHLSFRCLRRFLVYLVRESCQPKEIVVHGTECHWLVSHGKVLLPSIGLVSSVTSLFWLQRGHFKGGSPSISIRSLPSA